MFTEMDTKADGTVTKEEFINFLRNQRQLQNVFYGGLKPESVEQDASSSKISPQTARAMGIKRIISVYKDMNRNQNGVLTWDEFLDFFRRTRLLLVYSTPANPRDSMAAALASEYQQRVSQTGEEVLGGGQQKQVTFAEEFLVDEKEQQQNTQWAGERLSQPQEQSSKGKGGVSPRETLPPKKAELGFTPRARRIVKKHTQSPVDGLKPQPPKQPATQPETTTTDDEESDGEALRLPSLLQPLVNGAGGQGGKLLFIRKGKSCSKVPAKSPSSKCQVPAKSPSSKRQVPAKSPSSKCQIQEASPKKTSRSCIGNRGSRSPKKRGRTPRHSQRALTISTVSQTCFGF
jgi:hypothetical protein